MDMAVKELQTALRAVLAAAGQPVRLYPDGFFGPETGEAVRLFQRLAGLPETGEAGGETWDALRAAYREVREREKVAPLPVFPGPSFVIGPGASGELVAGLQRLLAALAEKYPNIPRPGRAGVFDAPTGAAVRQMQRKGGLAADGLVGRESWNLLMALLDGEL